jgi:uncharacterized protein (DUF2062 family)
MDRKLARKNLRTAIAIGTFSAFLFGLTFVVAAIYLS